MGTEKKIANKGQEEEASCMTRTYGHGLKKHVKRVKQARNRAAKHAARRESLRDQEQS